MKILKQLSIPLDSSSPAIVSLFEKMLLGYCVVSQYSNQIELDLTNSNFTQIGDRIMSTKADVILKYSEIDEIQAELSEREGLRIWMNFTSFARIELELLPRQSDEFWNVLKCLEMDRPA